MANGTQSVDVWSDPKFFALPESDQVKILSHVDKRFSRLRSSDQTTILKMRARQLRPKQASPVPEGVYSPFLGAQPPKPAAQPEEEPSFFQRTLESVESIFKRAPVPAGGTPPAPQEEYGKAEAEQRAMNPQEPPKPFQPIPLTPPPLAATQPPKPAAEIAVPNGASAIHAKEPGFWTRIYETVRGNPQYPTAVSRALGEPGPTFPPLIQPAALFTNMGYNPDTASRMAGGLRAAAEFIGQLTELPNIELIAAGGGAGTVAGKIFGKIGASVASRLVSAGFGTQMLYGLYKSIPEFKKALDEGDEVRARDIAISGGLSGYFGVAALGHAVRATTVEAAKETVEKPIEEHAPVEAPKEASKAIAAPAEPPAASETPKPSPTPEAKPEPPKRAEAPPPKPPSGPQVGTKVVWTTPDGTQRIGTVAKVDAKTGDVALKLGKMGVQTIPASSLKAPWQVSLHDYVTAAIRDAKGLRVEDVVKSATEQHEAYFTEAQKRGEAVTFEDYPELAPKAAGAAVPPAEPPAQDILRRRLQDQIADAEAAGRHDVAQKLRVKLAAYTYAGEERRGGAKPPAPAIAPEPPKLAQPPVAAEPPVPAVVRPVTQNLEPPVPVVIPPQRPGAPPPAEVSVEAPPRAGPPPEPPAPAAEAPRGVEPPLPGMGPAVEEQRAAAAQQQGQALSAQINAPPPSISAAAGEMERSSALFAGTPAGGMEQLFAKAPVPAGAVAPPPTEGRAPVPAETPAEELTRLKKELAAKLQSEAPRPGPGAKTAGPTEVPGTPIEQLTAAMKATKEAGKHRPKPPLPAGAPTPAEASKAGRIQSMVEGLKGVVSSAWELYDKPPKLESFDELLGWYDGEKRMLTYRLRQYAKELRKAFPDLERQRAMTNWREAAGDEEELNAKAAASKSPHKRGYELATKLDAQELTFTENAGNFLDAMHEKLKAAGILEAYLEDYVPHRWKRDSVVLRKVRSFGGFLKTGFPHARHRTIEDYFTGEQAGKKPVEKALGVEVGHYTQSAINAILGRGWIRAMLDLKAPDGRPAAVLRPPSYSVRETSPGKKEILIRTRSLPEKYNDYGEVPHPAMRRHNYVATDRRGIPIRYEADILIHPEYYRRVRNILTPSVFRNPDEAEWKQAIGELLKGVVWMKQTVLGPMTFFHEIQTGMAAMAYGVNPFGKHEIDLSDPITANLIHAGLPIADPNAGVDFSEGTVGGGLWDKIEEVRSYRDRLFGERIPKMMVAIGHTAYNINKRLYGKSATEFQLYRLSASEAAAAQGILNYNMDKLTRSKTTQDILRLVFFAPMWNERLPRIWGRAATPKGAVQLLGIMGNSVQMMASALLVAGLAKVILSAAGKDKEVPVSWSVKRPFSVRIGKHEYDARGVAFDSLQAFSDWSQFLENKLTMWTSRPALEALRGRDPRGYPRTAWEQFQDALRTTVPIAFQGISEEERHLWESALSAFGGVHVRLYHSDAEKLALKYHQDDLAGRSRRHETGEISDRRKLVAKMVRDKREGKEVAQQKIDDLVGSGELSVNDARRIDETTKGETILQSLFPWLSLRDKLDVWEKMTSDEKRAMLPVMQARPSDRRELSSLTEEEAKKLLGKIEAAQRQVLSEAPRPAALEPPPPAGM